MRNGNSFRPIEAGLALLAATCSPDGGRARGSGGGAASASAPATAADVRVDDPAFSFVDVTTSAGVDFVQHCGADGRFNYPETLAGGGGFFDADGDGDLDLFLVNGCSFPPQPTDPTHRYYRNRGDGTFEEATRAAGLAVVHRGMGSVAADIDDDGDQDLLVTGVARTLLFLNRGDGTFEDRSDAAGIQTGRWSSAATFFDYDQDGRLDLALGHYVRWSEAIERKNDPEHRCVYQKGNRDYCPVADYAADAIALFKGRGDGTFLEVTDRAGLAGKKSKALGMLVLDVDGDRRLDLLVANDTLPTQLFRNQGDGTFVDVGYECGLALDPWGHSYAGMGVDGSFEADGGLVIAVGNFSGEPVTFLRQPVGADGRPLPDFEDLSARNGLRAATLDRVTWGVQFHDWDRDGDEDLFVANGHVGHLEELEGIPWRQPGQVFRRDGERLTELRLAADAGLGAPVVGRGLAAGDCDGDGDVDLVVFENQGRVRLLENRCQVRGSFLRVRLQGGASGRDGIGALVTVRAGGRTWRDRLVVGASYLSMSELVLPFGLGALDKADKIDEVEVLWPSGSRDVARDVARDSTLLVREGESGASRAEDQASGSFVVYAEKPLAELEVLAARRPDDAQLWKALGIQALQRLDLPLADRALARAIELAPDDHTPRLHRLRLRMQRGDAAAVRTELVELFDRFGYGLMTQNAFNHLRHAQAHDIAGLLLEEALRREPGSATLHYRLANLNLELKRFEPALAGFLRAAALDPGYWRAHLAAATIYLRDGDAKKAEAQCRAALAVEPGSLEALRHLARALHAQQRDAEVPAFFHAGIAAAPEDFAVREELLVILGSMGRREALEQVARETLAAADRALALEPKRADALRAKAAARRCIAGR